LKIGRNELGVWLANSSYGDFGCGLFGNTSFSFARYHPIPGNNSDPIHFSFTTSIRSVEDPLVLASYLTGGLLYFDFGQRLKWMVILAFFSVGGVCSVLFLVITCRCVIERHFDTEELQPLVTSSKEGSLYGFNTHTTNSCDSFPTRRELNPPTGHSQIYD